VGGQADAISRDFRVIELAERSNTPPSRIA